LSTVLWPEVDYSGLLRKPDVAFLCVMVFAGALRLERSAILASTVASLAALVGLSACDLTLNAPRADYRAYDVEMAAILIGVAGASAWFSALAVRRALARVAREATTRSRAENHLREVLRDHHDVRTQLSSARLHLDLLLCEPLPEAVRSHAAAAARAIADIAGVAEGIRRRTFSERCANDEPASVELAPILRDTVASVGARFPAVTLRSTAPPRLAVALFGGDRGLVHVLANLLANACEGNGRVSATTVELRAALDPARPGFVKVDIDDDGPGFSDEILNGGPRQSLTTKTEGAGLGLGLVVGLIEASGGELQFTNRATGGSRVSVLFRSARGAKTQSPIAISPLPLG
jgi:signal transduction histidine kinase